MYNEYHRINSTLEDSEKKRRREIISKKIMKVCLGVVLIFGSAVMAGIVSNRQMDFFTAWCGVASIALGISGVVIALDPFV